jgi:hypothetical protein
MPFKSQKQLLKFRQLEKEGKLKKGTVDKWLSETTNPKSLPEKINNKQPKKVKKI